VTVLASSPAAVDPQHSTAAVCVLNCTYSDKKPWHTVLFVLRTYTHTHTHRPDTDYDREVDGLGGVTRGMTYRFDARNSASYLNFQFEQWGFLLHSRLSLNFRFECSGLDKETSVDTGGRAGLPCLALVVNHVSHQKFTIRIYKFYAVTVAVKQGSMTN